MPAGLSFVGSTETRISQESLTPLGWAAGRCLRSARLLWAGWVRAGVLALRHRGHHAEADRAAGYAMF